MQEFDIHNETSAIRIYHLNTTIELSSLSINIKPNTGAYGLYYIYGISVLIELPPNNIDY